MPASKYFAHNNGHVAHPVMYYYWLSTQNIDECITIYNDIWWLLQSYPPKTQRHRPERQNIEIHSEELKKEYTKPSMLSKT